MEKKQYLVMYDLKSGPNRDYGRLYKHLSSYDEAERLQHSTWVISTGLSIESVRRKLSLVVQGIDDVFIVDLSKTSWERLGPGVIHTTNKQA